MQNSLYLGDNLRILAKIPNESIDLIYIDPPFFSKKDYKQFSDKWDGMQTYLDFLNPRFLECKRILKETGSLFVHLDWHACHYAKVELDRIFGYKNFINEIIWCYSSSGHAKKGFSKKHDSILFYAKTKNYFWSGYKVPISETHLKGHFKSRDSQGKPCRIRTDAGKQRVYYLDNGQSCPDWWYIKVVGSTSKKRTGYPTQKPIKLLERIIEAASGKGDTVLDCFCGSGTTLHAAQNLNRNWIGIDSNPEGINIVKERLKDAKFTLFRGQPKDSCENSQRIN